MFPFSFSFLLSKIKFQLQKKREENLSYNVMFFNAANPLHSNKSEYIFIDFQHNSNTIQSLMQKKMQTLSY